MVRDESSREGRTDSSRGRQGADKGHTPHWIDSQALLGDRDEVLIRHGDQMYRLRVTRQGKLILNK
jgi:hemin uptake protein HemP